MAFILIALLSFLGTALVSQEKIITIGFSGSTSLIKREKLESLKNSSKTGDTTDSETIKTFVKYPPLPIRKFTVINTESMMNKNWSRVIGYRKNENIGLVKYIAPRGNAMIDVGDCDSIEFQYITDSTDSDYTVKKDLFKIERNKPFRINIVQDAIAGKRATLKEMNGKELLRLEIDDEDYQKPEQFDFKLSGKDDKYFSTKRLGFSLIVTFKKLNPEKFDKLVEELENRSGKNRKILKFEIIVIDTIAKYEDNKNHEESMTFKLRFNDYD